MPAAVRSISTDRDEFVFTTREQAKTLERQFLVCPKQKTANTALRTICFMLHGLAQRYVPNTPQNFEDYATFIACTNLLFELGLKPPTDARTNQGLNKVGKHVVVSSFQYRHLKNKAMASLSAIADLTEKPASVGSSEFRRGMLEAYRRASDIAASFLEEIETDFSHDDE
jgi:hypothetical protein